MSSSRQARVSYDARECRLPNRNDNGESRLPNEKRRQRRSSSERGATATKVVLQTGTTVTNVVFRPTPDEGASTTKVVLPRVGPGGRGSRMSSFPSKRRYRMSSSRRSPARVRKPRKGSNVRARHPGQALRTLPTGARAPSQLGMPESDWHPNYGARIAPTDESP